MRALRRPAAPAVLADRAPAWTAAWVAVHEARRPFRWPDADGRPLNQILREPLVAMTQEHCAYCDGTLGNTSPDTIDHFKPKTTFPHEAFAWANLFPACALCQKTKGAGWSDDLLKPDVPGYRFAAYFVCDPRSGEIQPNPLAAPTDRERALETIRTFGLNAGKRPQCRSRSWTQYRKREPSDVLDDFDHRDFIEALEAGAAEG